MYFWTNQINFLLLLLREEEANYPEAIFQLKYLFITVVTI